MRDKISVIVPVYNVEQYLSDCIESILAQTYINLEVILVDDGSPDRCGEICDAYAGKDSRIRVIHQKNGGISAARNSALDIASGDWIGFVDSDDWICPEMYERLLLLVKQYEADIAQCGMMTNLQEYRNEGTPEIYQIQGNKILEAATTGKLLWMVWCNLYRAEIWESIRFPIGYVYEDVALFPQIVERCDILVKTDEPLYFYNQRQDGIVKSSKNMKNLVSKERVFELYNQYFLTHPEQLSLGGLYMCKNIPAYVSIITPNDAIPPKIAKEHNRKMHALFCRYYPLAKMHQAYRMEPLYKRLLWQIYRISPMCAIRLMKIARG